METLLEAVIALTLGFIAILAYGALFGDLLQGRRHARKMEELRLEANLQRRNHG